MNNVLQVTKEDIEVRFFEEIDGQPVWEGLGDFQHSNVHKQVAISFRTPQYRSLEVEHPVQVAQPFIRQLLLSFINESEIISIIVLHSASENLGQIDKRGAAIRIYSTWQR